MGFIEQLIDGGDESYQNQQRNPYAWRATGRVQRPWVYDSYSGSHSEGVENLFTKLEYKESYGHPFRLLGRTNKNIGGEFTHAKLTMGAMPETTRLTRSGSTWRQGDRQLFPSGSFRNLFLTENLPSSDDHVAALSRVLSGGTPLSSDQELDAWGTTAIARIAPTNPLVDLSTSVAELMREGLPQAPGSAGNVGGEYLNVMFGYLPLFGDLSDLAETARNADKLLRQYERDSGRWVRRRYKPDPVATSSVAIQQNAPLAGAGSGLSNVGTRTTQTTTSTETWFEGVFTYYLPRKGWRRTVAELDYLYGIQPGVDTAWELTGFSWLADYFANIGDVMSNLNSFSADGLVMPYGYVMRKQTKTVQEHWLGVVYTGGVPRTVVVENSYEYVTHQRRLANPFGFGLTTDGLSSRQQSILVALGISRL